MVGSFCSLSGSRVVDREVVVLVGRDVVDDHHVGVDVVPAVVLVVVVDWDHHVDDCADDDCHHDKVVVGLGVVRMDSVVKGCSSGLVVVPLGCHCGQVVCS